jgi:hypothetical protein
MACGAGHWRTALLASGFTLVVLIAGRRIEQFLAAPLGRAAGDYPVVHAGDVPDPRGVTEGRRRRWSSPEAARRARGHRPA